MIENLDEMHLVSENDCNIVIYNAQLLLQNNVRVTFCVGATTIRANPHTKPRARDHYTSSTLIGGKGRAGPSSLLHIALEGPTEYVNARWM